MTNPPDSSGITPRLDGDPERVADYRIAGRLGAGGMGTVYAGVNPQGAPVAVKVIRREFAAEPDFRARFAREVALLRRVRGTCLPLFHGADTAAEKPWLATDYVPGPTLRQYVTRNGPLPEDMAAGFAAGCAEALAAVHAAGVVHRDLKPGNVVLAADGPKVLDFGIARAVEESAITRTGGLAGTPGWIAPEQYAGVPPDATADMFAWGALVAFAATGRAPFGAGYATALARRVLYEEPDLEGLPADLLPLVRAALAKDPAQRPTADEALRALAPPPKDGPAEGSAEVLTRILREDWRVETEADPASWAPLLPAPPWWRRRSAVAAAAVLLLVLTVAGGWSAGRLWGAGPDAPGIEAAEGPPAEDAGPPGGTQEVRYGGVALHVPEEWVVHEDEIDYSDMAARLLPEEGESSVGAERILLLQTDPEQSCDAAEGWLTDTGCEFLWLVGPVTLEFGNAGGPMTRSLPFSLGNQPIVCPERLSAAEPVEQFFPELLEEQEIAVEGHEVLHQVWEAGCISVEPGGAWRPYEQRIWWLPDALLVDQYRTEGLAEIIAAAQIEG